ncbi:MAG: glycosyltransferase family 4 protein [Methanobacteriota archaeon]|nr:MAG: glycosyltransferase family 4 protein [Euryarchaeota archaeon]
MRIVQVSPYFYPHVGGVESHVLDLSTELVSRGHHVSVLTTNLGKMPDKESMMDVEVIRLKPLSTMFQTPIVPRTEKYLKNAKADIIHTHSPPPLSSYYAARGCKTANIPFIITYHCDVEIPILMGKIIAGVYRRTLESYTVKRAEKIIVTSGSYHATSRTVWKYNPRIIPNAVDANRFNPEVDGSEIREKHGIGPDEHVILFVGRMVWHKGVEYLIEASKHLENTKFLVVGSGEHLGNYKSMALESGVADRVIFTGRLSWSDLPKCYAASDVFVLPSISRLEAFGITTLEAMATGKAVIVADIPGVREVIDDGKEGLVFDVMDAEDLAKKASILLGNPELRKEMGKQGRKKVEERFTIATVADQVEELYEEVLSSSRMSR